MIHFLAPDTFSFYKMTRDTQVLVAVSLAVGFLGDALLQFAVGSLGMGGETGWGLRRYFAQHGPFESAFIAAGMMGVFYALYLAFGFPIDYTSLAIYGVVLDIIFRATDLFPSLDGYYRTLNYFWSAVWGAIPLVMPLALARMLRSSH